MEGAKKEIKRRWKLTHHYKVMKGDCEFGNVTNLAAISEVIYFYIDTLFI